MKLFLLGKSASVTHWLEDAAGGFRAAGHTVEIGFTRRPWLSAAIEGALEGTFTSSILKRIDQFGPAAILVVGGFHAPPGMLQAVAAIHGRPPLIGWVGDLFDETARAAADLYDAVAYTDSALEALHRAAGFSATARYVPHAVNPAGAAMLSPDPARRARMVFVANPTKDRRAIVAALRSPITLYGPGWGMVSPEHHEVHPRRVESAALRGLYRAHAMALNIRNEQHVLSGLNQRNFEPCLMGAALITDDQPDLERCFDPGAEVAAWSDVDELNAIHERLLAAPGEAAVMGERARRRVLAEHTYGHRLSALLA